VLPHLRRLSKRAEASNSVSTKILVRTARKRIAMFPRKPDRMPSPISRIDMGTVVTEAATGLLKSIKQGILEACPWVIERLHDHTDYQALIEEMKNAMNPRMAEFLQGIGNDILALE
jgi:hypothetical protein